jgi:hypothetical protein
LASALFLVGLMAMSPPRVIPGGDARVDVEAEVEIYRRAAPSGYRGALRGVRPAPDFALDGVRARRLGARTLADALRQVPGLSLSRDTRGGWRVAHRGLRAGRRVAVYVDGARADGPWDERAPLELPIFLVERVEVRRGPMADRPGAHVVVDVTTLRERGGHAHAQGGSFATFAAGAGGAGEALGMRLGGGVSGAITDGPRVPVLEDAFTPQGLPRDPDDLRTRANDARVHAVGTASGALPVGELDFAVRLDASSRGPWLGYFDAVDVDGGSQALALQGRADWRLSIAQPLELRLGLDVRQGFADLQHQVVPSGFVLADRDGDGEDEDFVDGVLARERFSTTRAGLEAGFAFALGGGHELDGVGQLSLALVEGYRLEMNRDLIGVPQGLGSVPGLEPSAGAPCVAWGAEIGLGGACRVRARAALTDRWALSERVTITGALTLETVSDGALDALDPVGGSLAAAWRPTGGLELGLRGGRGLVTPSLEERHTEVALAHTDISTGGYLGDPAVTPEVRSASEAWARWSSSTLEIRASAFLEHAARAIERVDDNGNVETITNRGDAVVAGAEAWGRARFGAGRVFGQLSWFRGAFIADECALFADCSLLTETPQLRADVGGEVPVGIGWLGVWIELGSERRNNARTDLERLRPFRAAAYSLLNVGFESEPLFGLRAFAQVQNVLDAAHADDLPRPDRVPGLMPRAGVAAFAGIRVSPN